MMDTHHDGARHDDRRKALRVRIATRRQSLRTSCATLLTSTTLAASLLLTAAASHPAHVQAAPRTTGTGTPVQAVVALVGPMATPGSRSACQATSGQVQTCPITARLRYRLGHYQRGENGNIISRSQNPPRTLRWAQIANNGFVARVDTRWGYGASTSYTITFVVARQDDGWRVDDAYCAGRPQTSIYNPPTGPCV